MIRNLAFVVGYAVIQVLSTTASVWAADFGTPEEAKPMLERAAAAHGAPFGETIMQNATEGTIKETTYWWPRPGSDEPFEKKTLYTKVGDQICGVGYYKK